MKKMLSLSLTFLALLTCATVGNCEEKNTPAEQLLAENLGIPYPAVIAHRGASFYAPESTEPAYRLARNLGADYLECDLQRTSDGVLIALHDNNLKRTTNISEVFPNRADEAVSTFTLAELKSLDAGTWFNKEKIKNGTPELAKDSFVDNKICTLDELINIAEGKLANGQIDPMDNGNRPGIYIETKVSTLFPGIEKDLYEKLKIRGWLGSSDKSAPEGFDGSQHVGVQFTPARTMLQTFEPSSLPLLNTYMPDTPKIFLIWLYTQQQANDKGSAPIDQKDSTADLSKTYGPLRIDEPLKQAENETYAQFSAKWEVLSKENYQLWLEWAKANGAVGTGPGAKLTGFNDPVKGAQSYMDTIKPWMNDKTHELGMLIHCYTIDEEADMEMVMKRGVDGFFTNRCDKGLTFFNRKPYETVENILTSMGYK